MDTHPGSTPWPLVNHNPRERIERILRAIITEATEAHCPPTLASAIGYAVFPGGSRIRSQLCFAVADACNCDAGFRSDELGIMAASIELLHCASLVHDDLPCFDDAPTRRGRPSVHSAFGNAAAVLVGDSLIVLAFDTLVKALERDACSARISGSFLRLLARAAGPSGGLVAGQAWELESRVRLQDYHRAKTGTLFEVAAAAGALASHLDPSHVTAWAHFGKELGEVYQITDDIADVTSDGATLGKPVARDEALLRPSAVREVGLTQAVQLAHERTEEALASMPDCPGASALGSWLRELFRKRVGAATHHLKPARQSRYAS